MDQPGIVAADPVATFGIDRRAIRATGVLVHVDEQAAVGRGGAVDVVIEGPDLLHQRMGVGQVHGPAVRAEGQAVGHDQAVQLRL
ncbi:hypothetical protein D3C81_1766910 [compost metagenome]